MIRLTAVQRLFPGLLSNLLTVPIACDKSGFDEFT